MMSHTPAHGGIVVSNLTKSYPRRGAESFVALEDVSFAVEPGHTLAVVGESGAGKSTLVRCLSGLDAPTSGEVLVGGEAPRLKHGRVSPIQMVFQNPTDALDPMRSVGSSVAEPLRGRTRRDRRARVAELMSAVGLNPARATDRPHSFSGGQLQRIVIARALAPSPRVLLCDEPTSALDVSIQGEIINLILELQKQEGFACVVVTHDLAVAKVLADQALVLRHGRSLFLGDVSEMVDSKVDVDPYVDELVATSRRMELET